MFGWSSAEAARLAFKTLQRLGIVAQFFRQEFQCYGSPQLQVFRPVHHPHAAAAHDFQYAVVRDGLAG